MSSDAAAVAANAAAHAVAAAGHQTTASVGGLSVGWTTVLVALLNLLVGGVLVAIVKSRPALKKIANDREANLLTERAEEMSKMRGTIERLEARLDAKEIQHDAERTYDRHRINNLATALNAFFMLVKQNPRDAATAASMIEDMRLKHNQSEEKEAAELRRLVAELKLQPKGIE